MKKVLVPLKKFTHVLPALIFPLAMAGWQAAHADAVVSWGGNMVSANTNLVLPSPTDNGGIRTWKWNTGSPNISPNSGYTGQPFYGALQIDAGENPSGLHGFI